MRTKKLRWMAVAALVLGGSAAHAGDGRLEINQTCVATGCFAGDDPGFPVQAAQDKSYVLTSSLVLESAATDGVVLGSDATLDMKGFAITGPYECSGVPPVCPGTGNGIGVVLGVGSTVRDGVVRGMRFGVVGSRSSRIENLTVEGNADAGVGGAADGMVVRGNRVSRNGGSGVLLTGGDGALISENTVLENGEYGIRMSVAHGASVIANTIVDNVLSGISMPNTNGYAQNVITGNGSPQVVSATQVGSNLCGNDTVCP